jgi:hypothetical protein
VFKPDVVWIETEDEKVLEKRENPKASFVPLSREKPWDHLHALYFSGYAGLNYQSEPFMFTWPGFEVNEIEPWEEDGQRWRRLRVLFPDHIPTHCKEQVYYINEKGLIQRHDYVPELVKLQAPAAQYLWDHKTFSGITLATRRRVVRREQDGKSAMSGPTLIWREGNFGALLAILDPDIVLRADAAAARDGLAKKVSGAPAVARGALAFSDRVRSARLALVNGAVGVVVAPPGRLSVVLCLTIEHGKIIEIDVIADPARVRQLYLAVLPT